MSSNCLRVSPVSRILTVGVGVSLGGSESPSVPPMPSPRHRSSSFPEGLYMDPNGSIDLDDVRKQQAFWLRQGVITSTAPIDERTDLSFAEAAVQTLGRV